MERVGILELKYRSMGCLGRGCHALCLNRTEQGYNCLIDSFGDDWSNALSTLRKMQETFKGPAEGALEGISRPKTRGWTP